MEKRMNLLLPLQFEAAQSILYTGFDLFRLNSTDYRELARNSDEFLEYQRILRGLPDLTFELGFLEGSTKLVQDGYKAGARLFPDKEVSIDMFASICKDEDSDESSIELFTFNLIKDKSYQEWQRWRFEGINSEDYTTEDFPHYNSFGFKFTQTDIYCNANSYIPENSGMGLSFPVNETDIVDLQGLLVSTQEFEADKSFRFLYQVKLENPIEKDLVDKLNKIQEEMSMWFF